MSFVQNNGKLRLSLRSPTEQGKEVLQVASWTALSEYALEHQGTELKIPRVKVRKGKVEDKPEEEKPFIQIFRGGREL